MPIVSPRIAVVFATMHRRPVAAACVAALAVQSRTPEWIVVADNGSNDDTVEFLRDVANQPGCPFQLQVLEMPENLGNAGGVGVAMDHAFALGADAVWILDDDSIPRPEALEELLRPPWNPRCVRHAMQIDPKTGVFTWPLQVLEPNGTWKLAASFEDMPPGETVRSRIIWTGALVPRTVREIAGPVMAELFIRGEDEEYPLRFEQSGFTQEAVVASILDHPGPDSLRRVSLLGKHFFFETGLADWKLYYKIRNMVWLKKHHQGPIRAVLMALCYGYACARLDGVGRLPLVWEAACDGWSKRLGKWSKHPG
jgi:GT2 family glycosyltransferase